jgi:hypothetical protein
MPAFIVDLAKRRAKDGDTAKSGDHDSTPLYLIEWLDLAQRYPVPNSLEEAHQP